VQTESHRLIEQLMVSTNEAVARLLAERKVPCLYRVHERPDPARVERLVAQLASLEVPTPAVPDPMSSTQSAELLGQTSVKVGEHSYRAFGGQPTEERIDVWVRKSEMPTVQIDCAAPLEVTWTIQGTTERRSLEPSEAGEFLTREIARALTERKAIVFDADAAGFGRLSLRIAAEELRISEGRRTIAPMALYRARWLAATIAALRRGDVREVGVDRETRTALADVAGHPGCGGLGNLMTVPVEVAPHVQALTGNLALATMRGATPQSSVGRV